MNARTLAGMAILFGIGCVSGCASGGPAPDLAGGISEKVPATSVDPTVPSGGRDTPKRDEEIEPNDEARDFEIRCHTFYRDPTDATLEDHALPGPRVCTAVVDGSTRFCTIPLGETTCAINLEKPPSRLEPTSVDVPTLPGSQAQCRPSLTGARARFLCNYGVKPCTSEKAASAQVMYYWDCDSSHLVSLTIDGVERTLTVPESTPVTIAWSADPEAGDCKLTSRSVPLESDAGFSATGRAGTLETTALSSTNSPYIFTLTCVNAAGQTATSSVTAYVRME